VKVHDEPLVDGLVQGQVVVSGLKLAVEPAGQIPQRLGHDCLGVLGQRLPGRAVAGEVRRLGVFVVEVVALAGLSGKLLEAPPRDGLPSAAFIFADLQGDNNLADQPTAVIE
jgi:hypothetical protein